MATPTGSSVRGRLPRLPGMAAPTYDTRLWRAIEGSVVPTGSGLG